MKIRILKGEKDEIHEKVENTNLVDDQRGLVRDLVLQLLVRLNDLTPKRHCIDSEEVSGQEATEPNHFPGSTPKNQGSPP
jgi:hypothetical protein